MNKSGTSIIPRWNLSSIYESFESEDFKNDMKSLDKLKLELNDLLKSDLFSTDFPQWVADFVEKSNRLQNVAGSLYAYVYSAYSVDTTNSQLINQISCIENLFIDIEQINLKFSTAFSQVVNSYPQSLSDIYTRFPQLEYYSYIFEETVALNKHNMKPELEELADQLNLSGAESFSRLQEQIISTLKDPETGKTFNQLRNDAYDKDRALRKASFEKELKLLEGMSIPLTACLNSIKGTTITLNKRRLWQSALDKALAQSRISAKTLDALIGSIESSIPLWQEYLAIKAKLLFPNEKNPKLAFYDLFAPLEDNCAAKTENILSKTWTFEEAKNYIIERFSSFSSELGEFAQNAFANNWVDAEIREGKVGGAYCMDFPKQKVSRIFRIFQAHFQTLQLWRTNLDTLIIFTA